MYTYSIKKKRTRFGTKLDNNEFLEHAYSTIEGNKFEKGFVQDITALLDSKAYKNAQNTHGAILDKMRINPTNRTLDILIDGGLTGIKQFIIDEEGGKKELSNDDIVGLKFYARFWLPAGTKTAYVFIQKYGSMSIKPIFDSILIDLLKKYELTIFDSKIKASTTKERLKQFLRNAALKNITIVSTKSINATGAAEASSVEVKLKNYKPIRNSKKKSSMEGIKQALESHGFTIANKQYEIKGTYEYSNNGITEERTAKLDATEETINIVPNIVVPPNCIDEDNYPIFDEMINLVDTEMEQVKKESKI
jgi:hypothetical protein